MAELLRAPDDTGPGRSSQTPPSARSRGAAILGLAVLIATVAVLAVDLLGSGPPRGGKWSLVFHDDFNGSAVDESKWELYAGRTSGDVGDYRPSQLTVADGEVRISGRGSDGAGMAHVLDQLYGRWEIRARMDKGSGYGPAILLWPQSERWPIDGEIDIAEQPYGDRAESFFTVHFGADNETVQHSSRGDFSQWHVFALEWEPGELRYYLDGKLEATLASPAEAVPTKPMHLALQVDTGPIEDWIPARDAQTPEEVSLHVDWVRVYRPRPS